MANEWESIDWVKTFLGTETGRLFIKLARWDPNLLGFFERLAARDAALEALGTAATYEVAPASVPASWAGAAGGGAAGEGAAGAAAAGGGAAANGATIGVAGAGVTVAAIVVPAIALTAVFAALGAGYYVAVQMAQNEETASGFSQGFTMGVFQWQWHQAKDRFFRNYVHINQSIEEMNTVRVNSYNKGLMGGFLAGKSTPKPLAGICRRALLKLAHTEIPANWSAHSGLNEAEVFRAKRVQINWIIDVASAGRVGGFFKVA